MKIILSQYTEQDWPRPQIMGWEDVATRDHDSSAPRRPRTHSHAIGNPLSTIRWSLQLRSYCRERATISWRQFLNSLSQARGRFLTTDHRLPILTNFSVSSAQSWWSQLWTHISELRIWKQCASFFILELNGQSKYAMITDDQKNNNMYLRRAYPTKQSPSDAYTGWTLLLDTDVL